MAFSQHFGRKRRRLAFGSVAVPTQCTRTCNTEHHASVQLFDVDEYRLVGSGMVNVWYGGHVSKEVVSIRT
jgi:hypothetical protein